jgi:serine protease AprX
MGAATAQLCGVLGGPGRTAASVITRVLLGVVIFSIAAGPLTSARMTVAAAANVDPANTRIDPELTRQMRADPLRMLPVIVEMRQATPPFVTNPNGRLAQAALTLLGRFGRPVGALALINSAAGFANAAGITSLSLDPQVAYVHADSPVRPASVPVGGKLASAFPPTVNATDAWLQGFAGRGITVAVLDSGVRADEDLTLPTNRLLAAVNFAGDSGGVADSGGHGTHVGGTIAGNGYRSAGEYVGVAPGAGVVDVRVLNRSGHGRISSVVRGIEWVLAHRSEYNIRLINLSLGMPARLPYRLDPLCAAVEIAWLSGVTVVAAAGNGGPQAGSVESPGIDPYILTAGATDDRKSFGTDDDVLTTFSAWGSPPGSTMKPDVVAPGRRLVSLPAPGSFLDGLYPERLTRASNGQAYFWMSGTSMATAVTSGTAALLIERRPYLTPDGVKDALMRATQPYGRASGASAPEPDADGSGLIDSVAALNMPITSAASQGHRPADAVARALYPVVYGQPLVWNDPTYRGINWTLLTWTNLTWDTVAWDNLAWDHLAWDHLAWDKLAFDNLAWDNLAWDHLAWDHLAWDGHRLD